MVSHCVKDALNGNAEAIVWIVKLGNFLSPWRFSIRAATVLGLERGMVAEDRLGRNHRQQNCLFSAIFNKRSGETRYHNPLGWRLEREFQIWLTQAFARLHAKFDHEASRASKNMQRRLKRRRRSN
jgi:hypothetical protein